MTAWRPPEGFTFMVGADCNMRRATGADAIFCRPDLRNLRRLCGHSGALAKRGSPESTVLLARKHGFRARRFAAPRNDSRCHPIDTLLHRPTLRAFRGELR